MSVSSRTSSGAVVADARDGAVAGSFAEKPGGLVVIGLSSRQSLLEILNANEKLVNELKHV